MRDTRGFLLIIVIGMLAVLLVLCVGFLSYTRTEIGAVANIRDKCDGFDIFQSATDYITGAITADLIDGSNKFKDDINGLVSNARGTGEKGYRWWYRPYEQGLKDCFKKWETVIPGYIEQRPYSWKDPTWPTTRPDCVDATGADQAEWVYMPKDFFPTDAVRGRFMVQVLDPNAFVCLNDYLDDCMPTQCQMAHMIMDGYGEQELERYRSRRDQPYDPSSPAAGWNRCPAPAAVNLTPNFAPIRYEEAWRVATRTVRYCWWNTGYQWDSQNRYLSPSWVTTNHTWLSGYGAEWNSLKSNIVASGLYIPRAPQIAWGATNYYPPTIREGMGAPPFTGSVNGSFPWGEWHKDNAHSTGRMPYGMPFSLRAYVDPDTGRCPVNVNTMYNSGERMPSNVFNGTPVYTMEAVFNVESLRRIILVGEMTYKDSAGANQTISGQVENIIKGLAEPDRSLAWNKHENLRTKLAYQYQETLCRYFTGTYRHPMERKWAPLYNPTVQTPEDFSDPGTYAVAMPAVGGVAEPVAHAVTSYDYTKTRFPADIHVFRQWMHADFMAMCGAGTYGTRVRFDLADKPNIVPGQLDCRTAAACYDNIIPGKPANLLTFNAGDPLMELYRQQIGRDELVEDIHESADNTTKQSVFGYHYDNGALFDTGSSTFVDFAAGADPVNVKDPTDQARRLNLRPKGRDIALTGIGAPDWADASRAEVPFRQLAFGPDWFSTELTTTTTAFMLIVNSQVVDSKSADPALGGDWNKPRDIFHGQWGISLEIAPDVYNETKAAGVDPKNWIVTTTNPVSGTGLGYYGGTDGQFGTNKRWPTLLKTVKADPKLEANAGLRRLSMDKNCSSLRVEMKPRAHYANQTGAFTGAANPVNQQANSWQDHWRDANNSRYRRMSAAPLWLDFRGVRDVDAPAYYANSGPRVDKRIVVRAVWSHNQGINR